MKHFLLAIILLLYGQNTLVAEEFIVGVEDLDYLPQFGYDQHQEYGGIGIELLRQFAQSEPDIEFKFAPYPINRLHHNLLIQEIDFKYPDSIHWNINAKQAHSLIYSGNLVPYTDGLLVLPKNHGKTYKNVFIVGLPLGFTPVALLKNTTEIKFETTKKLKINDLINLALLKRVDGIYMNIDVGLYRLQQMNKSGSLVFDESLPHVYDFYQLSTIRHKNIITKLNRFIDSHPDLLQKLQSQYKTQVNPSN